MSNAETAPRAHAELRRVRQLALEVAPYKADSLRDWLAARSVPASIADVGVVTVPTIASEAELGRVMGLVRRWMRDASVEALFASCDGAEVDVASGTLR